jgi:hypothetical protein
VIVTLGQKENRISTITLTMFRPIYINLEEDVGSQRRAKCIPSIQHIKRDISHKFSSFNSETRLFRICKTSGQFMHIDEYDFLWKSV